MRSGVLMLVYRKALRLTGQQVRAVVCRPECRPLGTHCPLSLPLPAAGQLEQLRSEQSRDVRRRAHRPGPDLLPLHLGQVGQRIGLKHLLQLSAYSCLLL